MRFADIFGFHTLIFDGGMGTLLQARGLKAGQPAYLWSIEKPETVADIHKAYISAGCDVITTNTFGIKLDTEQNVNEIVLSGVKVARSAAEQSEKEVFVALDIGSIGELLEPFGKVSFEQAYDHFSCIVKSGVQAGADFVLIETMTDLAEAKAALLAAKENCELPVVITYTINEDGRLLNGADIVTAAVLAESLGADGVGLNCGFGPDIMLEFAPQLLEFTRLPVIVSPNAGLPKVINSETVYDLEPTVFADDLKSLLEIGCAAVGGCCGTTPEHLRAVYGECKGIEYKKPSVIRNACVSSASKTVFFSDRTVLIGERINPTGKPVFRQALKDENYDFIRSEAVRQSEAGAEILDVNCGAPGIDEVRILTEAVKCVQSSTELPLQIDTSDPAALESALRAYVGKPIVNSVNGTAKSLSSVLPLCKKYGAMVVALTLDENGIPAKVEDRIAIAERIINEALKLGINKADILVDPLTLSVSTADDAAVITLESLSQIKDRLAVKTVLGVSNVSFGLPCREKINAAFFALAMRNGLDAGIINPLNAQLMDTWLSYNAVMGIDNHCSDYVAAFASEKDNDKVNKASVETNSADSLKSAVIKGFDNTALECVDRLLEKEDPLSIINEYLIPALDEVGKAFERKRIFIPQLLMSANAASAAFERIKSALSSDDNKGNSKGDVILATVKGDVHDIGKNIVKVLLESYGFNVIDLGRDVSPFTVLEAVENNNVKIVGLSALMTTTLAAMEETISLLHEKSDCQVIVGGAVLTEEYAHEIGADFYAKDAMCTVRIAEKLIQSL